MSVEDEVDLSPLKSEFEEFFSSTYKKQIYNLATNYPKKKSLNVDYADLERFSPELADELTRNPDTVIDAATQALVEMKVGMPDVTFEPHVRFFGLPDTGLMVENISSDDIGRLISVKGVITKRAEVVHKVKMAFYKCALCGATYKVPVTKKFTPPQVCDSCRRRALKMVEEESYFVDLQKAEAQELLERLRGGEPAAHIQLWLEDDLVNVVTPGDTLEITGIVRLRPPMRARRGGQSTQPQIYSRYLDIIHVKKMRQEFEELEITEEDEKLILELSKDPHLDKKIANSIAPAIYGHDEVKEAIALQLFGGTKDKELVGGGRIRDDIHVLLIGDPGAGKSRILLYTKDLAPKSIYVSGKSVSGVGLTAAAERDELGDGGWTLKAGALVLASGGVAAVDEFEKIDPIERGALHEMMETQSYHQKTKIMLSDGREIEIGELVESYMAQYKDNIVHGHNCMVLREGIEDIRLLTTDFNKIMEVTPAQISKHTAPDYYIKILLQTGRELLVTPEHPVWVVDDGRIITKEAEKLTERNYTLMPRKLPIKEETPSLPPEFFKFLGYHITDGGYELNRGLKNGINFYNKDAGLIEDYQEAAQKVFANVPIYHRTDPSTGVMAARIISVPVLKRLMEIHSPLAGKGKEKTIPPHLLSAPKEFIVQLLRAAFDGDGTFSGHYVGLVGENKTFIEQIQLLLLRLGIRSHIFKDGNVFRLVITGVENLERYLTQVGFLSIKKRKRLEGYLQRKMVYRNTTDVIPNCSDKVFRLLRKLKIYENSIFGYGLHSQKMGYCFTRKNFIVLCKKIREKIEKIQLELASISSCKYEKLIGIRMELNLSQHDLSQVGGISRATISYWERKRIFLDRYRNVLIDVLKRNLSFEKELAELERFAFGEIGFVAIRKVEKVPNQGEKWVYDVTVEPNRTFISECTVLHNTVSVAKAGIVAQFKAKTAILAAANPKLGRFDPNKLPGEQFAIPPTLLSRFDLIFPIIDVMDEEQDTKLAGHILALHKRATMREKGDETIASDVPLIDRPLLRKYISYARRHIRPVMTSEAGEKLKDFYAQLRKQGQATGAVPITPRQIEGLIRLSEANAKMRLSNVVEESDAEKAIRLVDYVLRNTMMDRTTGIIDIDTTMTGIPKSQRDRVNTVLDIVMDLQKEFDEVEIDRIIDRAKEVNIDEITARRIIEDLVRRGELYKPHQGYVRFVLR